MNIKQNSDDKAITENAFSKAKTDAHQILSEGKISNRDFFFCTRFELTKRSDDPEASKLLRKLQKLENNPRTSWVNKPQTDKSEMTLPVIAGQCIGCGMTTPVAKVNYGKVTGLIIVDRLNQYGGLMCERCNRALYRKCMKHCLIYGWWGLKALVIINPATIIGNTIMYTRTNNRFKKYRGIL